MMPFKTYDAQKHICAFNPDMEHGAYPEVGDAGAPLVMCTRARIQNGTAEGARCTAVGVASVGVRGPIGGGKPRAPSWWTRVYHTYYHYKSL